MGSNTEIRNRMAWSMNGVIAGNDFTAKRDRKGNFYTNIKTKSRAGKIYRKNVSNQKEIFKTL